VAKNVFADAYIRPTYDLPNPNPVAPFLLHSLSNDPNLDRLKAGYRFDNIATEADETFWTVYLLGAYQPWPKQDKDPQAETGVLGVVDAINGVGANVFMEVNRVGESATRGAAGRHDRPRNRPPPGRAPPGQRADGRQGLEPPAV
jgi:hypothetical protein